MPLPKYIDKVRREENKENEESETPNWRFHVRVA